ncbi:hypothetical protein [uncultured Muribaculum sp.]|uniref:hypothetical protein n=1 Tax=uncultured Muribaculum sp. TaxID=1918613 RepID=UPI002647898B|nr:hypothetical protein [uncultured Muribaculum sp.]
MKYDKISSGINSEKEGSNSLLEAAAAEARRISCAIQEVAGTTACKGVQINGLKKWAIENSCWIDSYDLLGEFSDRGSEFVYHQTTIFSTHTNHCLQIGRNKSL